MWQTAQRKGESKMDIDMAVARSYVAAAWLPVGCLFYQI